MSDPEPPPQAPEPTDASPTEPLPEEIGGVIAYTEQMRASLVAGPEN